MEEYFWLIYTKMVETIERIKLPEDVKANIDGYNIKISGPKGEVVKRLASRVVSFKVDDKDIVLTSASAKKKSRRQANSFRAHIRNSIRGVMHGFEYKLKICSGHFPMKVTVEKDCVKISNFLGEKIPRISKIIQGVNVKLDGDFIVVNGNSIEDAGQTAANIEKATKIRKRDRRVFQDGIYIIKKPERMQYGN